MEISAIVIRACFAWMLLWVLTRLSGKETVSQLSGRTLTVTIILSDLPGKAAFGNVPVANFVAAAGALILVHSAIALITASSDRAHDLIDGPPALVLSDGRRRVRGMRRERISEKELEELLRLRGVDRRQWSEIETARVEREGKISVVRRLWARPLQRKDVSNRTSSDQ